LRSGAEGSFNFRLNQQFEGFARDLYELLRGEHSKITVKDRLGPLSFETSEQAVPIQVGDLFTYLTAKYCEWRIANTQTTFPEQHLLQKLLANTRHTESHTFLNKAGLAEMLEQLPSFMRESLKAERKPIHKNQRRIKL
jgi:hypothetical protein